MLDSLVNLLRSGVVASLDDEELIRLHATLADLARKEPGGLRIRTERGQLVLADPPVVEYAEFKPNGDF